MKHEVPRVTCEHCNKRPAVYYVTLDLWGGGQAVTAYLCKLCHYLYQAEKRVVNTEVLA